jgi:hypothetical protein
LELTQLLRDLAAQADDADPEKMEQVHQQLELLVKYNLGTYVPEDNVEAVRQELTQLLRWIRVKTTRLQNKVEVAPEQPQIPQLPQDQPAEEPTPQKNTKLARNLGLGAAIAAVAAAAAALFHIRRKGRKK